MKEKFFELMYRYYYAVFWFGVMLFWFFVVGATVFLMPKLVLAVIVAMPFVTLYVVDKIMMMIAQMVFGEALGFADEEDVALLSLIAYFAVLFAWAFSYEAGVGYALATIAVICIIEVFSVMRR